MKKPALLLTAVLLLLCAACSDTQTPQPEYAIGESVMSPSYLYLRDSFAEVIEEAQLLAEVEIVEYYGDMPEEIYEWGSLYRAKILTCYKNTTGEELTEIKLVQNGNSKMTFQHYPLFQTGDRLLLAMVSCRENSVLSETHPEYFRIIDSEQTAMQIVPSEDGDVCFTYLPIMNDFPTGGTTADMMRSANATLDRKHRVREGQSEPIRRGNRFARRDTLEEWIREVLSE